MQENSQPLQTCPVCGEPIERIYTMPPMLGQEAKTIVIPRECLCRRTQRAANERAEEERRAAEKLARLRADCFKDSGEFADCTFDLDDRRLPNVSSPCKRFADTFNPSEPYGLLLWGPPGTGKSFMSAAIANRVVDRGYSAYQTDMRTVTTTMESSFQDRRRLMDHILTRDLLCIEDLGAQRSTEYVMEQVYTVIDGRYKAGKPMVITTNLSLSAISHTDTSSPWCRVFDRILEMCLPIEVNGGSRRREKGMETRKIMRERLGIQ